MKCLKNIMVVLFLIFFFCFQNGMAENKLSMEQETIYAASEPDYPPFSIVNEKGEAAGFSVDLFKEAVAVMGLKVE